jgi:hypothetical protein
MPHQEFPTGAEVRVHVCGNTGSAVATIPKMANTLFWQNRGIKVRPCREAGAMGFLGRNESLKTPVHKNLVVMNRINFVTIL